MGPGGPRVVYTWVLLLTSLNVLPMAIESRRLDRLAVPPPMPALMLFLPPEGPVGSSVCSVVAVAQIM